MNYIGSKRKLADVILAEISNRVSEGSFCDLFAGTGAVSEKFAKSYDVIVNDWEFYSYCVNYQKFGEFSGDLQSKINILNSVEPLEGFIYDNYSPGGPEGRMYFTAENAAKIDAMRCEIEILAESHEEKIYLLALLLEAADKVANVASVYGAYLKKFKDSALKSIVVKDLPKFSDKGVVTNEDANTLDVSGDILYLDPPYNTRHYGANYHMLNTIATYDEFTPKGITGLPLYKKSPYCSKVKIKEAFEDLISGAKFSHIFISYNDEGILNREDFESICSKYGSFETIILDGEYRRFKADSSRVQKQDSTIEYLYYIKKTNG